MMPKKYLDRDIVGTMMQKVSRSRYFWDNDTQKYLDRDILSDSETQNI